MMSSTNTQQEVYLCCYRSFIWLSKDCPTIPGLEGFAARAGDAKRLTTQPSSIVPKTTEPDCPPSSHTRLLNRSIFQAPSRLYNEGCVSWRSTSIRGYYSRRWACNPRGKTVSSSTSIFHKTSYAFTGPSDVGLYHGTGNLTSHVSNSEASSTNGICCVHQIANPHGTGSFNFDLHADH